jgi:FHS family L-fucose permease-like MFS transporter
MWGVVSQFFYVGAQVGTWSFFMQYVRDYTGMAEKNAGYMLTGTLVAFALGRFTAAWFMRYMAPRKLMGMYAVVNIGLVGIAILAPGLVGVWALFLTSFFMSLMFPTNYALAVRDLGSNTKIGGSFVIMSIIGAACLPPVMGLIFAQGHSMALAEVVPLVAYCVIAWYAYKGSVLAPTNVKLSV